MTELVDVRNEYDIKYTSEEARWRASLVREHRKMLKVGELFGQPLNSDTRRKVQAGEINNHRFLTMLQKRGVKPGK